MSGAVRRELQTIFDRPAPLVNWQVVGPWQKPQEPKFDMTHAPDLAKSVTIDGQPAEWRKLTTKDPQGRITLNGQFKPESNVWAMAYTTIEADEAGTSYFEIGRDDQAVVWVNGEKIYEFLDGSGWAPDSGHGPLPLKKGVNHIWVQAGNGGGPWEFSFAVNTRRPEFAFLYENVQPKFDTEVYSQFAVKNLGDASTRQSKFSTIRKASAVSSAMPSEGRGARSVRTCPASGPNIPERSSSVRCWNRRSAWPKGLP